MRIPGRGCDGCTPLYSACVKSHFHVASYLVEQDPELMVLTDSVGHNPLYFLALRGEVQPVRTYLSMNPSVENQQTVLRLTICANRESFGKEISQLPVFEWRRQVALQHEYLCVEHAVCTLVEEEECQDLNTDQPPLCLLVLRSEVLSADRLHSYFRQVGRIAVEWHAKKIHRENPLPSSQFSFFCVEKIEIEKTINEDAEGR